MITKLIDLMDNYFIINPKKQENCPAHTLQTQFKSCRVTFLYVFYSTVAIVYYDLFSRKHYFIIV